jgi:hypothetical protein
VKFILEFYPAALETSGVSCIDYLNTLYINYKFKLFDIDERDNKIVSVTPSILLKIYSIENKNVTNLLCMKDGVDECLIQ